MPKKQRYGGLSSRHDLHHHRSCYRFFEARAAANLRDPSARSSVLAVSNFRSA
jgi:hypothetical protein